MNKKLYKPLAVLVFLLGGMITQLVFISVEFTLEKDVFALLLHEYVESLSTLRGFATEVVVGSTFLLVLFLSAGVIVVPTRWFPRWRNLVGDFNAFGIFLLMVLFCFFYPPPVLAARQVLNGGVEWASLFAMYPPGPHLILAALPTYITAFYTLEWGFALWDKE